MLSKLRFFLEDNDDMADLGQRIVRRKRDGRRRVRVGEPGEHNASHCESGKRMRVHAELARVLSTATIGTSDRDGNDWSMTFPRQKTVRAVGRPSAKTEMPVPSPIPNPIMRGEASASATALDLGADMHRVFVSFLKRGGVYYPAYCCRKNVRYR
jgi:hypothetical protein